MGSATFFLSLIIYIIEKTTVTQKTIYDVCLQTIEATVIKELITTNTEI